MDDIRDEEVNVVSSPESSSRNASPEPEGYNNRLAGSIQTPSITCFPVIKTSGDEASDGKDKGLGAQKITGSSTNFSISSILSRTEPTAKKNGFVGIQNAGQGFLDVGIAGNADSAMLSR